MTNDPDRRPTFLTTILPIGLVIFTIAAIVLIFGVLGQGGSPARRERPPTSEVRVEGTAEVESTVEVTGEAATLEPTQPPMYTMILTPSADMGAFDMGDLLGKASGVAISSEVPATYAVSVDTLCNGGAVMAILDAFAYLAASERGCIEPGLVSVRMGSPTYSAQIITLADSGIETIEDLRGKTFCRPDPGSISGWEIPRLMLLANGIDPETDLVEILDAGGHDGVIRAVYDGQCDAGATYVDARTLVENELPDLMDNMDVIAVSDPIPHDVLVFSSMVPDEVRQAVIDALKQSFAEADELGEMLYVYYAWTDVEEVDDSLYDPLRQLFEAAGENVEDYVR